MADFWKGLLEPEAPNEDDSLLLTEITSTDAPEIEAEENEPTVDSTTNQNTIDIDETTDTTLHEAVALGNVEELKKLLTNDMYVKYINGFDSLGRTPLYIAAENNNIECLTILLENRYININKSSSQKGTPAFIAAKLQHIACLNELTRHRGIFLGPDSIFDTDSGAIRIQNAIALGEHDKLREEIDKYKDNENFSKIINGWDRSGTTLMHLAVEKNDVEALRILIENQADPNKSNIIGGTPIYIAAYRGNKDCLIELIQHQADINQPDIFGETPAYIAALNGYRNIFDILLNNGADINKPAYLAAVRDNQTCLMFLVEKGADLTYVGEKGDTTVDALFTNISEPSKCMIDILNSKVDMTEADNRIVYNLNFEIFTRSEKQMQVISCLLQSMNDDEEAEILNHPVCEMYLFAKMNTNIYRCLNIIALIAWYIYFGFVFFYIGSLTELVNNTYISRNILRNIVLSFSLVRLMFGILQIIRVNHHSSWWEFIRATLHVVSVGLIMVLVVADRRVQKKTNPDDVGDWFPILTDVVLVLHYIEYIAIHMKFRLIGNYYVMFLAVLRRTVIALLSFFFLIFSFVVIFQRQFFYYNEFSDIFRSTLKTIVLMIGELEYENTFKGELAPNPNAENVDTNSKRNSLMPRVMILIFIIFIHLSLLNLMTGLAVEHVTDVKKRGRAVSLKQQAQFLAQAEDMFVFFKNASPASILKRWSKLLLQKTYINKIYKLEKTRRPLVSQKLFDSLNKIARKRRQETKSPIGTHLGSSLYYTSTY